MLEVRGISKTYRAKTGVSVKALDNVNLTFPETGMVFLLGKSGSGKSTLLNVIGGLDKFDTGELIIKGRSSADFRKSDFDAYRNTFIGFIFQEYNILDEFTVGANIALALELQGKKASSEEVNAILEQVDLQGYASRKPNELSGGQKQRIAIARALIKDPEIIMADEPTGALDSTTGRQVLDTLKALSKKKLVLVVSHDREFAEKYADRIVELSDGRVISDLSLSTASAEEAKGVTQVSDDIIHIRRGYLLTEEDMRLINAYLAKNDRDIILSKDEQINSAVCQSLGITGETVVTAERVPTGVVTTRQYNGRETRFIKSRLPLKNAARMGANSMKTKPVRLIFTIFLSFIAFALFGLADTMASYNQLTATVDSLRDSQMTSIALSLYLREEHQYKRDGEWVSDIYYDGREDTLNEDDLAYLEETTGLDFMGVYNGSYSANNGVSISSYLTTHKNLQNDAGISFFDNESVGGITELSYEDAEEMGFTMVGGRFPHKESEIVISKYTYQMMYLAGVRFGDEEILPDYLNTTEGDANSILGKTISLFRRDFTIVGVVDTGFNFNQERYAMFHWDYTGPVKDSEMWQIKDTLDSELRYGYHTLVIGYPGVIDSLPKPNDGGYREYGADFQWENRSSFLTTDPDGNHGYFGNIYRFVGNQELEQFSVIWLSDDKTVMGAKDILLPIEYCLEYNVTDFGYTFDNKVLPDLLKDVLDSEDQYAMRAWIYDPETYPYETVYDKYAEVMAKKGETPLTYQEYCEEICKFYNDYYRIELTPEVWTIIGGYEGGLTNDDYVNQNIDEYATDRAIWSFMLENWDVIVAESEDSASEFYSYLYSIVDPDNPQNPITGETEAICKAQLLCYTARYIREYVFNGTAFGSTQTFSDMVAAEKEATKALQAQRLNTLYDVEFTYDMWMGLKNNGGSQFLGEYAEDMQLKDFVREKLVFEFIAANWDYIKEQSLESGTAFNTYLINNGVGEGGDYDPNKTPENGYSLEYNEGTLFSRAINYVRECIDNRNSAFGEDIKTKVENATIEYALAGVQNLTFPQLYFGYEQRFEGGSQSVVEKNTVYTIAGFFIPENENQRSCALSENLYQKALDTQTNEYKITYGAHKSGRYVMALAKLPQGNRAVLETLATLHNSADSDFEFRMKNNVADVIDRWGDMIEDMSKIFLYIGIGFAAFAALMMLNFISASVTQKKKEIGILRAVGARSSDVFSIFFFEAFLVAIINFILAIIAVVAVIIVINNTLRNELGFPLTLLHFGFRQVGLVLGVSVLVAFVGSFLPVRSIARKTPVDAMKDR